MAHETVSAEFPKKQSTAYGRGYQYARHCMAGDSEQAREWLVSIAQRAHPGEFDRGVRDYLSEHGLIDEGMSAAKDNLLAAHAAVLLVICAAAFVLAARFMGLLP